MLRQLRVIILTKENKNIFIKIIIYSINNFYPTQKKIIKFNNKNKFRNKKYNLFSLFQKYLLFLNIIYPIFSDYTIILKTRKIIPEKINSFPLINLKNIKNLSHIISN